MTNFKIFLAGAALSAVAAGLWVFTTRSARPNVRLGLGRWGEMPHAIAQKIKKYDRLVQRIEKTYERGGSPLQLEKKAAELREQIETQAWALVEEGGHDDFGPHASVELDDPITTRFAHEYQRVLQDPEEWADLQEFMKTGEGKLMPAHKVLKMRRLGGYDEEQVPAYVEYPYIVTRLRYSDPGLFEADPVELVQAAEDAYNARQELIARIGSRQGPDPVKQARQWLSKRRRP